MRSNRPTGMLGFSFVWFGQIVSVLATSMTAFAMTIFVFQKTGSATALGLMQVFFITPYLLITPIAGVMVDRHNRKLMMMVSDRGYSHITGIRRFGSLAFVYSRDLSGIGQCVSVAGVFCCHYYHAPQRT